MIVAWDTETTGFPDYKAPSEAAHQPHIVQLGAVLMDDAGAELETLDVIVKPDGWTIGAEAMAVHGITNERAHDVGIPERDVVDLYINFLAKAPLEVAHNRAFDVRIVRIAMLRAGFNREAIDALHDRPYVCTQVAARTVLKADASPAMLARNNTAWKTPKLVECYEAFFNEPLIGAHGALTDARATARVYFFLRDRAK